MDHTIHHISCLFIFKFRKFSEFFFFFEVLRKKKSKPTKHLFLQKQTKNKLIII